FFFQAEDGIRDRNVTGVQTCALPMSGLLSTTFSKWQPGLNRSKTSQDLQKPASRSHGPFSTGHGGLSMHLLSVCLWRGFPGEETIREMILGTMIYGTIGCILFFGILGNFGLYLQLSGSFDVISHMNEFGAPAAIIAILHQLPLANLIVPLFTI